MIQLNAAQRLLAETLDEYTRRLTREGIEKLGQGGYAQVFQHPTMPDVAVKLLHDEDPGYMAYVKFCRTKGKGNPYCPKILQVVKDGSGIFDGRFDPDLALVFMEKLKPLSQSEFNSFDKRAAQLARVAVDRKFSQLNEANTWFRLSRQREDVDLAQLARFIYSTDQGGKLCVDLDIHKGNIMKRGKQIVITDPFSD